MSNEGFNEYWAAYRDADRAIDTAEQYGGQIEDGERNGPEATAMITGLGLIAVARAIQAQTLGLRLSANEHGRGQAR